MHHKTSGWRSGCSVWKKKNQLEYNRNILKSDASQAFIIEPKRHTGNPAVLRRRSSFDFLRPGGNAVERYADAGSSLCQQQNTYVIHPRCWKLETEREWWQRERNGPESLPSVLDVISVKYSFQFIFWNICLCNMYALKLPCIWHLYTSPVLLTSWAVTKPKYSDFDYISVTKGGLADFIVMLNK